MKIYPVEGRLVKDPATGKEIVNPEGTEVPENDNFWLRRLADGDVSVKPGKTGKKGE